MTQENSGTPVTYGRKKRKRLRAMVMPHAPVKQTTGFTGQAKTQRRKAFLAVFHEIPRNRLLISVVFLFLCLAVSAPSLICAGPVPDTGQTHSYLTTPGEDSDYLINPLSYTKLDAGGNDLPDSASSWVMVRDNVTGLIWEVKTDDGSVHDKDNPYTWYDSNPDTNGGNAGTPGDGTDTEDFIAALNAESFGGYADWRLPTIKELAAVANLGTYNPAIDPIYFPTNTVSSKYWSSTTHASMTGKAWSIHFGYGNPAYRDKSNAYYVRAVRGGQIRLLEHLVINGDGTVSDTFTGLMWQQAEAGEMTWEAARSYCEGLSLAGYADWRLPNSKELQSNVDYNMYDPAIDTVYFPNAMSSNYWSSSVNAYDIGGAWGISFNYGSGSGTGPGSYSGQFNAYYVRAVRGGQSRLLGHLVISAPVQASTWNNGSTMPIRWDTAGISGNVKLSISSQGGKAGTFQTIIESVPNNGTYDWTVNVAASVNCVLRVEPASDTTKGTSQGLFSVEGSVTTTTSTTSTTSTSTTTTSTSTTTTSTSTSATTTTTLPSSPTVTTGPATPDPTSATLTGTVNPNGVAAEYFFEFGTTSKYGDSTPIIKAGSGIVDIPVSKYIAPLRQDTTYHYRLVASNDVEMSYGDDWSFTTSEPREITDSKVIMVAGGGPYAGNTIWDQVEMLSSTAYKALLFQGYTRDAIYYLSPNLSHDANGDKISDVDADATGENLAYAIKTWSQDQDVHQLVLYLVGHGGPEKFQIGETEKVSVQNLNTWLNEAQNGMVDQVVVLYDACRSGSFLPFLPPPVGKERIIAASTESGQNALILADGTISFSYLFWSHIFNGDGFYNSFLAAQDSLEITFPEKQYSQIEADGNGIGNEKADQTIAKGVTLGLGLQPQGALPVVGEVTSSPRAVSLGSSAVIYAEEVVAIEGIYKVWAVITPPGYSAAPDAPITDLPILDLSGGNGNYEGTYNDFITDGEYSIAVFVEDKQGFLSIPKKTTVTVTGDCLTVADDMSIWVPCAEYYGTKYAFTLSFFKHLDGRSGFYWKLDMTILAAGDGSICMPIGTDLSIPVPCVAHNGTQYGFTLRPYENPYDSTGLYWELDMTTLEVK